MRRAAMPPPPSIPKPPVPPACEFGDQEGLILGSISRFVRWLTGRTEPDDDRWRSLPIWDAEVRPVATVGAALPAAEPARPTLAALINAYADPTRASEKRGEGIRIRRMAAIRLLQGELTQQERALWVLAAGSPDIGSSSRTVDILQHLGQDIEEVRAKNHPSLSHLSINFLTKDDVSGVEDRPIGAPTRSCRGQSGGNR